MKLGLLIDLDTCVGCHACAVACKEWNAGSRMAGGAPDYDAYGAEPSGVWFNRIRHFELADFGNGPGQCTRTVNLPMACMHCEDADCVTVCPTGASYKRAEDGIVLVDQAKCIGCNYCAWACPYGARELDEIDGTMRKCTLCVDRIYDQALDEADRQPACVLACPTHARHFGDFADPDSNVSRLTRERGGAGLMEGLGYKPVNQYLPPRAPVQVPLSDAADGKPTLARRLADMVNKLVSL
jgi:Fe-S-cluster-containing dehydrogenase component